MLTPKTWQEFRKTGLLWFINRTLHLFGWAIVVEFGANDQIHKVYPARVKFRGFDERTETKGFIKLSKFLKDNIDELEKEVHL